MVGLKISDAIKSPLGDLGVINKIRLYIEQLKMECTLGKG
jgi:hypothetical protein